MASCRCLAGYDPEPQQSEPVSHRLSVNPIACEAHGMCAELLPERITLDDWGYPIIDEQPITPELLDHAKRAAQACPTFALLLERRTKEQRER
jgi:ferredoxin